MAFCRHFGAYLSRFEPLQIVNLVDFDECNPPASPRLSEASTAASTALAPSPCRLDASPADAELRHLRQMLADAAEEKRIQVAIMEDEVAELRAKLEATKLVGREAGS